MTLREAGLTEDNAEQHARHLLFDVGITIPCFICLEPIPSADACTWEGPAGRKRPVCKSSTCQRIVRETLQEMVREVFNANCL